MIVEQPQIFIDLCRFFHQDIGVLYSSTEALINDFLASKDSSEAIKLEQYLSYLAKSDLSHDELEKIWSDCGASFFLPEESAHEFFQKLAVLARPD